VPPEHTREPQYQRCKELVDERGATTFGMMANQTWNDDPKRLVFVLSRYKFVAKMFSGSERVLEVGCADAFGTRIVQQHVGSVTAVDFDPIFIADVQERMDPNWPLEARVHDMLEGPVPGDFDAVYALDVLEHIPAEHEKLFLRNMVDSLGGDGACIVGMPSIHSQVHASEASRAGHVNCKDGPGLQQLMSEFFRHVFIFSMNDEVVHTGFEGMANYLIALCAGRYPDTGASA